MWRLYNRKDLLMNKKKLGLANVVSISVGLVVATSCLVSLGEGSGTLGVTFILAMAIAMLLNMTTVASLSELNALMPNNYRRTCTIYTCGDRTTAYACIDGGRLHNMQYNVMRC